MNQQKINSRLKEINEILDNIYSLKQKISQYEQINIDKRNRNEKKFNEIFQQLIEKETQIKALMENKHFSYIQHIDFMDNKNINEFNGFNIENKIGCLVKNVDEKIVNNYINKIVNTEKTEIIYEFAEEIISNELEYSFYDLKGLPIVPNEIKISYGDGHEEEFYESNFRYYNRFTSNTFINNYLFNPKKIKKVKFSFLEQINISNDLCRLYSNIYNTDEGYSTLLFQNPKKNQTFNFSKKTDETMVPLIFEFSENNTDYTKLEFNEYNEAIIQLENKNDFLIRIKSDYNNFLTKEEKITKEVLVKKSELILTNGVYKVSLDGIISNIEIIFPYSSYNKISEKIESLGLKINDYIQQNDDIFYINSSFIKYIKEDNNDINKLKFFDDISLLKTNEKYFNFYFNTENNNVYFAPFLEEYEFYLKINYDTVKEQITKEYYTPFVFEVSLKG